MPKPTCPRHGQREQAQDERKHRQKCKVPAVGHDQPHLAARDRGELSPDPRPPRLAGVGGLVGLRWGGQSCAALPEAAVHCVWVGADLSEDVGPVGGAHRGADLARRPAERGLAAGGQQQHLIAHIQIGQRVGHNDDDTAGVGELAQHGHHLPVQRRVQPRGGFVEDQQRRAGQQLERHRCAFALPAGQVVHPGLRVIGHLEFREHLSGHQVTVLFAGVRRQPQLGGITEGLLDGQPAVHHVVLGHHPDPAAQRRVLAMDVVALKGHRAPGRPHRPGHHLRQSRLACTRGPDHRRHRARLRRERHIVQQSAPATDGQADPADL